MRKKYEELITVGILAVLAAWVVTIMILCSGCGSMAPIRKQIPNAPADPNTNQFIVNPVYTGAGEVVKTVSPAPYTAPAVAIFTSILAIVAIARNRKLKREHDKAKAGKE